MAGLGDSERFVEEGVPVWMIEHEDVAFTADGLLNKSPNITDDVNRSIGVGGGMSLLVKQK